MSPEMLDIDPDDNIMVPPTTESDVWALGCTIFEILAEELPYANYRHDIKIQRAILGGELPGPLTIDTEYRPTLESCWSKSPDKRPTATHLCALNNIEDDQGGPSAGSDSTDKDIDMEELFFSYGNPPTLESIARWVEDCKARREPIVCPLKDCKQILRRAHALKDHLLFKLILKAFPVATPGVPEHLPLKPTVIGICRYVGLEELLGASATSSQVRIGSSYACWDGNQ
ncbi:hypothetical protein B0J17DRAFT_250761 [Rhizoctonia solani]|nr:hypothetical protein B0J17DRAFT_250761 [Rhizoctonia solani]